MSTSTVDTQNLSAQAGQALFVDNNESEVPQGDPRRALLGSLKSGQESATGTSAQFMNILSQSCTGMSLRHLPPDVAQMILDSQAETIKEFFASWSESIQENAKLDREAATRSKEQKEFLGESQGFLCSAVDKAVYRGLLSPDEANHLRNQVGMPNREYPANGADETRFDDTKSASANGAQEPAAGTQVAPDRPTQSTGIKIR